MNILRNFAWRDRSTSSGFILPTVVTISFVLLAIGAVILQYTSSAAMNTQAQYYNRVAKEAANAGIEQALKCLEGTDVSTLWTTTTPLTPGTNCDGSPTDPGSSTAFTTDSKKRWKSTFNVEQIATEDTGARIVAKGSVELFTANGSSTVARTYTANTVAKVPMTEADSVRTKAVGDAVTKVSAGDLFTCAVANTQLYCTGRGTRGQRATGNNGGNVSTMTAVNSPELNGKYITSLESGYYNTCATFEFTVRCWGMNNKSQMGTNSNEWIRGPSAPNPAPSFGNYVKVMSNANTDVDVSQNSCALAQMKLFCAGANDYAQQGRVVVSGIWPFRYIDDHPYSNWNLLWDATQGAREMFQVYGSAPERETGEYRNMLNASTSQLLNARPVDLSHGAYTVCTLINARVFCWGDRFVNVTGFPTDANINGNVKAGKGWRNGQEASGTRVTAFEAGESTSCQVANGELYCWGNTPGNGTRKTNTPGVPFNPIFPWNTMSVSKASNGAGTPLYGVNVEGVDVLGDTIMCAYGDGDVYCWNDNELNSANFRGGNPSSRIPQKYIAGSDESQQITDIAVGFSHACYIANGSLYCRGQNQDGALGTGNTTNFNASNHSIKTAGVGLTSGDAATDISTGDNHSCGIANGYVYCWGNNTKGQIGDGTTEMKKRPQGIEGVTKSKAATKVAAGGEHSCAIIGGKVYCWGDNTYGQLGIGSTGGTYSTPQKVYGLDALSATDIATGKNHTCVIANSATYCWGRNNRGQLGNNSTSNANTPTVTTGFGNDYHNAPVNTTQITAGDEFSCAVGDARGFCWGANDSGQLGDETTTQRNVATKVKALNESEFMELSAGSNFVCGIINKQAHCWGDNTSGRLGRTSNSTTQRQALQVGGLVNGKDVSSISAGNNHACALANGTLYCWGANTRGKLGINSTTTSATPVAVDLVPGILDTNHPTDVSVGASSSCAIGNAKITCWGDNTYGQTGSTSVGGQIRQPATWTDDYLRGTISFDAPNTVVL